MKQFILKTSFFIIPFAVLYTISLLLYSTTEGPDLLRLGGIPNIHKDYHRAFSFDIKEKFDKLSRHTKTRYKILSIGDSFSEQAGYGYKNILADDFSVLHVDRFISNNQIQTLINLTNGDFFNTYDIEYVILQHVERHIIDNTENIKLNDKITLHEIDSLIKLQAEAKAGTEEKYTHQFFSKTTLEFPLSNLPKFFFQENYLSNEQVYNVDINSNSLFSNHSKKLLFYFYDLHSIDKNNNKKNIGSLNTILNTISLKLRQKNIKLIFLPSPDKYDFYYEYIADNKNLAKPLFFNLFKDVKKDYIYIDSKEILSSKVKNKQDIYFYDDTHWSPVASEIIAAKIKEEINKSE